MGVSTDAYLVFGIDLGAEEDWEDDNLTALIQLHDDCELDDEARVEFVDHCSENYRMWILAAKGTVRVAHRGDLKEINPYDLKVTAAQIDGLRFFCEEKGIKWKEPHWFLCSMWS